MKTIAFKLSLIIVLLTGCDSPYDSYPRDNLLVDNFNTKKEILLKLESDLQNQQLIASLGISRVYVRSDLYAKYEVWKSDLMGVGGCSKGYVGGSIFDANYIVSGLVLCAIQQMSPKIS